VVASLVAVELPHQRRDDREIIGRMQAGLAVALKKNPDRKEF
jgi:hypothetical protein